MDNTQLQEFIAKIAEGIEFNETTQYLVATVPADAICKVAQTLKDSKETQIDYLYSLTGVDVDNTLGVVYHLESTSLKHIVTLKAFAADREKPTIESICPVYKAADLQEREAFDFYGIEFKNHPDLRRIFMEEDWVGFPLRKDYVDTINIVEKNN